MGAYLSVVQQLRDNLSQRKAMFYPKTDIHVSDELLRTLAGRPLINDGIDESLALKAVKYAGIAASGCLAIPQQGTYHAIFLVENSTAVPHILRINRLSSLYVDWQLYVDLMVARALERAGIDHVDIGLVDCSRKAIPFDFQICGLAGGQSLIDLDHDDSLIAPAIREVARHLKLIHQIEGAGFGLIDVSGMVLRNNWNFFGVHNSWRDYIFLNLPRHMDICQQAGLISPVEYAEIYGYFAGADWLDDVAPRLLHGDAGNHNIFIDDGKVVLIDWEDCLLGDPLFDIAYWATFHPERRWGMFFNLYFDCKWQPCSRFWLYYLRVALSKSVHRLRFGYVDRPDRPKASLRIQRGLAGLRESGGNSI